jgi:hypothetical protein
MGVIESVRGVLWARRRQPGQDDTAFDRAREWKASLKVPGADPHGTLRVSGEQVLPALRD